MSDGQKLAICSLLVGLTVGVNIGGCVMSHGMQRDAIKAGVGRYSPATGEFEFVKREAGEVER